MPAHRVRLVIRPDPENPTCPLQLRFVVDGPIAFLTFNRPEAATRMTWEMYDALVDACERVDADPDIRVFVIRGAGGRRSPPAPTSASSRPSTPRGRPSPTSGGSTRHRPARARGRADDRAGQGVAAGGGCAIALACDLRVCTPEARFGVPIARTLGNCLSAANCARLVDLIGPARTEGSPVHRPTDRRGRG